MSVNKLSENNKLRILTCHERESNRLLKASGHCATAQIIFIDIEKKIEPRNEFTYICYPNLIYHLPLKVNGHEKKEYNMAALRLHQSHLLQLCSKFEFTCSKFENISMAALRSLHQSHLLQLRSKFEFTCSKFEIFFV